MGKKSAFVLDVTDEEQEISHGGVRGGGYLLGSNEFISVWA